MYSTLMKLFLHAFPIGYVLCSQILCLTVTVIWEWAGTSNFETEPLLYLSKQELLICSRFIKVLVVKLNLTVLLAAAKVFLTQKAGVYIFTDTNGRKLFYVVQSCKMCNMCKVQTAVNPDYAEITLNISVII